MGSPGHLCAHFRGMQWDSRDGGFAPQPLFSPAGDGVSSPHQRKVAQAWELHTSDTSWWPEILLMFGSMVSMDGGSKQSGGGLNSEKTISQKKDQCSHESHTLSHSLPQNSYWSLAFGISWYRFSLIQIGSRQNSEVSKMSIIEPHPNDTLR